MDETFSTLDAALRRIEELKRFITSLGEEHRREIAQERERTKAAEFDAEVGRWALRGMTGYQVKLHLPDFAQIKGNDVLQVADHLGKRAAHELLHGSKIAFVEWSEHHRALHHIRYLETHASNCGVQLVPFSERERGVEVIPDTWDWPTRQPPKSPPPKECD